MTLKDVAREAGVSSATVSYVLSGKKKMSPDVVRRVAEAVKNTGYKLNTAARALRTGGNRTIGLMIPDITNPFFPKLAQEIKHQARALGYAVILMDTSYNASTELEDLQFLQDKGVDGIIWVPSEIDLPMPNVSVPIVVFDHRTEGYSTVHADDFGGGRMQARHLGERGHHSVMLVSGPQYLRSANARHAGFLSQIGVNRGSVTLDVAAEFSTDIPDTVFSEVLAALPKTTCIACGNDMIAIGLMKRLLDHGVRIPEDVSLIGFDNNMMAAFVRPPLTTIAQSTEKLGALAVSHVITLIHNPAQEHEDIVVPVSLVERSSVKDLARAREAAL